MPKHGEERDLGVKKYWTRETYVDEAGKAYTMIYPSNEISVSERYCEHCKRWITCDTVISHIVCKECLADW